MSSGDHGFSGFPNPMNVYSPDAGSMPIIGFVFMICLCSCLAGCCFMFFFHEDEETKKAHERVKARKAAEAAGIKLEEGDGSEMTGVVPKDGDAKAEDGHGGGATPKGSKPSNKAKPAAEAPPQLTEGDV